MTTKAVQTDNHSRSIVKATTWRVIGTCDTIFLSWFFTGSIGNALKIGFTEVFTKIILFWIHERVWIKMNMWRNPVVQEDGTVKFVDHHKRSFIKGVSWRIVGTVDTIVIAFFWTGDYTKALSIGFAEVFTKVGLYYLHERVWLRTKWGTHKEVEDVKLDEQPAFN